MPKPTPGKTAPTAAKPPPSHTAALAAIQRKLDKWELNHLREHAKELADRLESAQLDISAMTSSAEHWRDQCFQMIKELQADGKTIGLTQDGQVGVMA